CGLLLGDSKDLRERFPCESPLPNFCSSPIEFSHRLEWASSHRHAQQPSLGGRVAVWLALSNLDLRSHPETVSRYSPPQTSPPGVPRRSPRLSQSRTAHFPPDFRGEPRNSKLRMAFGPAGSCNESPWLLVPSPCRSPP